MEMPGKLWNQVRCSAQRMSFRPWWNPWVTGPQAVKVPPSEIFIPLRLLELFPLPPEVSTLSLVLAQASEWCRKDPVEVWWLLNPALALLWSPRKVLGYGHGFSASSSLCWKMKVVRDLPQGNEGPAPGVPMPPAHSCCHRTLLFSKKAVWWCASL